jgi:hypothetical protein
VAAASSPHINDMGYETAVMSCCGVTWLFALQDLEAAQKELLEQLGSMTPRPSWRDAHKHGVVEGHGRRTQVRLLSVVCSVVNSAVLIGALQTREHFIETCEQKDLASV